MHILSKIKFTCLHLLQSFFLFLSVMFMIVISFTDVLTPILLMRLFFTFFFSELLNLFSSKLLPLISLVFILCLSLRITVLFGLFDLFCSILQVKPSRQLEVQLTSAALMFSTKRVKQLHINFGTIKSTISLIQPVLPPKLFQCVL